LKHLLPLDQFLVVHLNTNMGIALHTDRISKF
jgi:hypothetical protein